MLTLALLGRGDCQQTSGTSCASVACLWGWGVNDYLKTGTFQPQAVKRVNIPSYKPHVSLIYHPLVWHITYFLAKELSPIKYLSLYGFLTSPLFGERLR